MNINIHKANERRFAEIMDTTLNTTRTVWFEESYHRTYPLNSLACDLIGFTYSGDTADWGIKGIIPVS